MTENIAIISFAVLLIPCIYGAWSDLSSMKLPNMLTLAVIGLFIVIMPFVVSLEDFGWRIALGMGALVLGFVLSVGGLVGAGDAKFGAAGMLFVHPSIDHISFFVQILAMTALAGVLTHRVFRRFAPLRSWGEGWQSWDEASKFPFGISIATALLFYQIMLVILL